MCTVKNESPAGSTLNFHTRFNQACLDNQINQSAINTFATANLLRTFY